MVLPAYRSLPPSHFKFWSLYHSSSKWSQCSRGPHSKDVGRKHSDQTRNIPAFRLLQWPIPTSPIGHVIILRQLEMVFPISRRGLQGWGMYQNLCSTSWTSCWLRQNNLAMVIKTEDADGHESFQRVQSLRNMNDKALFAKACCSSNLNLVESLGNNSGTPLKGNSGLEAQSTILRGHVESSIVLEGRIRNAIDLVCSADNSAWPAANRK